ncbi:hypothetical protein [Enterococcus casseliflavus]|uniref:hypothetical protein n=1 Tax=Enterococcus casseliflavus TaxID=37734 RepID=UPI003D6A3080
MLKEKLNFIKMVFPNVEKIIPFVTEDNLEKLFGQAQQKVGYELRRRSLNEKIYWVLRTAFVLTIFALGVLITEQMLM